MATTSTIPENALPPDPGAPASGLLVSLTPLPPEALAATLANLALAFPNQTIDVTTPDPSPAALPDGLRITTYTPSIPAPGGWVLTAADHLNTFKRLQETQSSSCLLLGPEAQSLSPEALRDLAGAITASRCDLAMPRYSLGPRDGLVNSAILYPVTRALFATRPRYPLAIDLAFSTRMAQHLAACAQRSISANQPGAIVWPVAEAATAGCSIAEVHTGPRALPPPDYADLNTLLAQVCGSFFADLDAKAGFWQRARLSYSTRATPPTHPLPADPGITESAEIQPMLSSFQFAYSNLQEIWSLVLPPNSLLGLKKLSIMPASAFRMPDSLWARILYDFVLAYRLRTINRGHLLGALTPLYLAWVASHLLQTGAVPPDSNPSGKQSATAESHIESLAVAFETEKSYLVSRWRWPDRFNP